MIVRGNDFDTTRGNETGTTDEKETKERRRVMICARSQVLKSKLLVANSIDRDELGIMPLNVLVRREGRRLIIRFTEISRVYHRS